MRDDVGREARSLGTGEPRDELFEISESHIASVGSIKVRRALPRRGRRTVGAWCFADHMGPASVTEKSGLDVGPHPHIGLQTVTWLIDGQVLHHDSLGSEQVIAPGQLNLMTAGRGVSHAEEATGHYRGTLQGIQLWIAQPDATRNGDPTFEHFNELPQCELGQAQATVLVGEFNGLASPARHDTPLVGLDVALCGVATMPLQPNFEYALIVLEGSLTLNGSSFCIGHLGYLRAGLDELELAAREPTRAMLIGGEPFPEPVFMWWNFVARSRGDIDAAYESWVARDERFGHVTSQVPRIDSPVPYWR